VYIPRNSKIIVFSTRVVKHTDLFPFLCYTSVHAYYSSRDQRRSSRSRKDLSVFGWIDYSQCGFSTDVARANVPRTVEKKDSRTFTRSVQWERSSFPKSIRHSDWNLAVISQRLSPVMCVFRALQQTLRHLYASACM